MEKRALGGIFVRITMDTHLDSRRLTPEFLQEISRLLIELHRSNNHTGMRSLLGHLRQVDGEPPKAESRKVFLRLIKIYHPDSYEFHMARLARGSEHALFYRRFLDAKRHLGSAHPRHREWASRDEEYAFDRTDFGRDYFEGQELSDEDYADDVLSILNAMFLGNSSTRSLEPIDLEQLTETLDLSGGQLSDTDGIQYCVNITGLDLSSNNVVHIHDLAALTYLETLDLSDNQIESVESLRGLPQLEEVCLDGNRIEDLAPLLDCPRLAFLSVTRNPLTSLEPIRQLQERDVVVIYY